MLQIDIFSSSYCNMNGHQFCLLFHMIQGMSSASSLNIPDTAISTTANLDMGELFTWLERHKNQIGRSL